jgi:hypothetical protein
MEPKKRSLGATERDEFLRAAWRAMVAGALRAKPLMFVDECSTNTSMTPTSAYSPKGERARCSAPRNWGANITLLSSMSAEGMGPSLAVEGATTREVFEAYLEEALVPALRPGQIVVMDKPLFAQGTADQVAHRGRRMRAVVLATLLTRLQPHRGSLRQAQGASAQGGG